MEVTDAVRMAKRAVIAAREKTARIEPASRDTTSWVATVRRDGVCAVPGYYDPEACASLRDEVDELLARYPDAVQHMSNGADRRVFGAEAAAAGISEFGEDARLLGVARSVLSGNAANAFTLAAAISFQQGNLGSGEGWHRDSFFNQFKAIVYLTDVTEENGPFEYIRRSHLVRQKFSDHTNFGIPLKDARIENSDVEVLIESDPGRHIVCTATAGTLLLVDTTGIHRGMPLRSGDRYALTNYYLPEKVIGTKLMDNFSPVLGKHVKV